MDETCASFLILAHPIHCPIQRFHGPEAKSSARIWNNCGFSDFLLGLCGCWDSFVVVGVVAVFVCCQCCVSLCKSGWPHPLRCGHVVQNMGLGSLTTQTSKFQLPFPLWRSTQVSRCISLNPWGLGDSFSRPNSRNPYRCSSAVHPSTAGSGTHGIGTL